MTQWTRRLLLVGAVVGVILIDLWQHARVVQLGYEVGRLSKLRDQQQRLQRELAIERASLMALDRIERIAKAQLGMTDAGEGQVVSVQVPPDHTAPESDATVRLVRR
jgi:cell division protein FtsL